MLLTAARVQKYRSIRDTDWFEVDAAKTILVGPNEAGKTVLLQALQQINPPPGVAGFNPLRDYPRSEYNDIDTGKVNPADVTVVTAKFRPEDDDLAELPEGFEDAVYVFGRQLDNTFWHLIEGGPSPLTFDDATRQAFLRMAGHVDKRALESSELADPPGAKLKAIIREWTDNSILESSQAEQLLQWLDNVVALVDESNQKEVDRHAKLVALTKIPAQHDHALRTLESRLPVFVLFNNYFRVRPSIHLGHLASRLGTGVLDDDQYDYGNQCLLKLLGFTAQELSDLGSPPDPAQNDPAALEQYKAQLDHRSYKLNAASVRLTAEISKVWLPSRDRGESDRLLVRADGQYLKVVVEDALGVEIEVDQRSEGYQWLVSFFVVFFAEAADRHANAVLLLDEPGLSLHGLKQREFRSTVSKLAETNQTIYTTHSPFLVGPSELDLVRVVEMTNRDIGTKVHTTITASDPAALLPLQEALGYDLAQSLFAQRRNLVLEGLTDYWYIDATAQLLRDAEVANLNDKIALVTAGNAGKVVYFATILHAQSLKVAALLDSDTAGEQAAQQETLIHTLGNKNILRTKDAYIGPVTTPEIEDLLRQTLVAVASDDLGWDVASTAAAQSARPIVEIFRAEIPDFSKYRLAKAYLRWTRSHGLADLNTNEQSQWKSLIDRINTALK